MVYAEPNGFDHRFFPAGLRTNRARIRAHTSWARHSVPFSPLLPTAGFPMATNPEWLTRKKLIDLKLDALG
jgi:hypothetical protein